MKETRVVEISQASNGANPIIDLGRPYIAAVTLQGSADLLFHRWNCEAVEAKGKAAKGSAAKKTDDLETYVYRAEDGQLAVPGEYVRQAIIHASKFRQDPRSPKKSAMDLYKAGVISLTPLASLGKTNWDYEDRRRVVIGRSGVNRTRPAVKVGWKAEFDLLVLLPEYISPDDLYEVLTNAGRLIGLGEFRPTYGRFQIVRWALRNEAA